MTKKNLIAAAVIAAIVLPTAAFAADNGSGPTVFGYGQITGSQQFGSSGNAGPLGTKGEGLVFGANRLRLGIKGEAVRGVQYFFQYGWDGAWTSNGLGNAIGRSGVKDAYINFAFIPDLQLQVGKFITPVGLERTQVYGNELMFIQRSMNQALVPNRGAGGMFHSDNLLNTGIYYNLGIFDNASLSTPNNALESVQYAFAPVLIAPYSLLAAPVGSGQSSVGGVLTNGSGHYLLAGMVGYKFGPQDNPLLNVELSGARADGFTGLGAAKEIDAWNLGVDGGLMGIKYMAEYSAVTSFAGIEGLRSQDWYVAAAANLHQMGLTPDWLDVEPAVRYEQYRWNHTAVGSATLGNTTLGVNYYVNPNNPYAARVQLNYTIPDGGSKFRAGQFPMPANGYIYNTLALEFQAGF